MNQESSLWERITAISSGLLVITAIVALVIAYRQIQESRDEACINHLQDMVRQFNEPPVSTSLRSLALKRVDQKQRTLRPLAPDDAPTEMYDLMNFFETMGLYADRGFLDKKDIWHEFGWWLFNFYSDARPVVENEQKGNPVMFSHFSQLMKSLEKIENENGGGKLNHPSPDELYVFYEAEIATPGEPIPHGRKKNVEH